MEAIERLERFGLNCITPPKRRSLLAQFFGRVLGLFNLLLIVSGILSFVLYAFDPSSMANTLVPPMTMVIRDGKTARVLASQIAVGDLVLLKTGDKVPADLRLIMTTEMRVDNSSITGESEPQERNTQQTILGNPLEAQNLAFSGTLVANGEGIGVVIRTGDNSILGQIAFMAISETSRASQLSGEIGLFVKKLAAAAVATAVVFFAFGLVCHFGVSLTFNFAIGIFVAFVPQGLPATVTLLLSIAARRMAGRNVLVKNLHAVETLGSITLLATDKTGTLTQNKMAVVALWLNDEVFAAQTAHTAMGEKADIAIPRIGDLLQACSLCTKSRFDNTDAAKPLIERRIFGDATETGILRYAARFIDVPSLQESNRKVFEIPFSSTTKWHLSIHHQPHERGIYQMYLKGAPERVVSYCTSMIINDRAVPWDEGRTERFNRVYEKLASQGLRVLAFACKKLPLDPFNEQFEFSRDTQNFSMQDFTFMGLVSLMDPPKRGVRKAIAALRTAGIQVVMVTGDHPLTAEAVARQVGLIQGETLIDTAKRTSRPVQMIAENEYEAIVVHGDKLDSMSDVEWDLILSKREVVFARTSPKHKLEIVNRCQRKGHIVGASGDGVNDSPALKKADLGISMNLTGSDVSKEAASMILLDDNFPSIVNGVTEGRLIFSNLKKSIRYTLTHIMPEIVAFVVFIIFRIPLPVSSMLLLFVDLVSELGPALSYAFEASEKDLMLIPPRKVLVREPRTGQNMEPAASPTKWKRFFSRARKVFSPSGTGEVLVDNDLLIWCYLEAGLIESAGCFGAYLTVLAWEHVPFGMLYGSVAKYFAAKAPALALTNGLQATAKEQLAILGRAQGAYFAGIVVCQWFNLFVCKHQYTYPNKYTYFGILFSASVLAIIIYVPFINNVLLQCDSVPAAAYLPPIGAGMLLFAFEFAHTYLRKKGHLGGVPKRNRNLLELVRTNSSAKQ